MREEVSRTNLEEKHPGYYESKNAHRSQPCRISGAASISKALKSIVCYDTEKRKEGLAEGGGVLCTNCLCTNSRGTAISGKKGG